ncbi:cysteine desulfurase [Paenibacillus sp. IB182496]|uniref:Cysteine desulfurase n=1 Tax=Paenibacillus sabuli TaxID=2772509 RepID=A0A927GQJ0_9BACL|nr:cysteine desulfurase family protein [Paenibacillus sabuli]MBD2844428.1 cysteine desulfurase [Paenibacillus sabuli]
MLYFDHCASTPPREDVVRTMAEVMTRHYANPGALHRAGAEASKLIERAREAAASQLGGESRQWVFTSGGTESNNLALLGAARAARHRGRHIVTTAIEHPSVLEPCRQLEREGYRVTYLPVDRQGRIKAGQVAEALTADTILVSIMHVNNEVGAVQPIAEIGALLKDRPKTLYHVDAVQSVGKLPVRPAEWGVDLLSVSAHKLRGPRGAGWLYVRNPKLLDAQLRGGKQEAGLRAGTPNTAAIVAAAKALRLAVEQQEARHVQMSRLRARLVSGVSAIPELHLIGGDTSEVSEGRAAPHILALCYPGLKAEVIVHMLEKHGVIVSTKSACSSRDERPSAVLLAMGHSQVEALAGIRISFGDEHTEAAIDSLVERLRMTVAKLKPLRRLV